MAFKLAKDVVERRDALARKLAAAHDNVVGAVNQANHVIQDAVNTANIEIQGYNALLAEVEAFKDEIAQQLRDEYDEKSETWQQSDKGEAVAEFVESWESWSPEEIEEIDVDEIEQSDNAADDFANMPTEV